MSLLLVVSVLLRHQSLPVLSPTFLLAGLDAHVMAGDETNAIKIMYSVHTVITVATTEYIPLLSLVPHLPGEGC